MMIQNDKSAINQLVKVFFASFDNRDAPPDLSGVRQLFIDTGVVIKNSGPHPEIYSLDDFIAPRQQVLSDGSLTHFHEYEIGEHTDIFGNIAQRVSLYKKTGNASGQPFQSRGIKVFQFIRTPQGWRISSVAWDDEREGFLLPDADHLRTANHRETCVL